MDETQLIIKRGNEGVHAFKGAHNNTKKIFTINERQVRCIEISNDGKLIAFSDNERVKIIELTNFETIFDIEMAGVQYVKFSPKATILATWSAYRKPANAEGEPNMYLYNVKTGEFINKFIQKKMTQWCPSWTYNETICGRQVNSEVYFYEKNQFEKYVKKFTLQKCTEYTLTTNKRNDINYMACYTQASKGQPSFVRIYQYPRFEGNVIANKSFYKADSVSFLWNSRGDSLLLLCAVENDKSGKCYYGEQMLHYMDIKGNTYVVKLNKDGPIHNVAWTPSSRRDSYFCVIYGFLPGRIGMFNNKAELVFEFGEPEMVNLIEFNPFGNLVVFAGFGSLRGGVFVWDVDKKKLVSKFNCPETTLLKWCDDGVHLITATTAPRLRVGNGFKIWNYMGKQLFSWPPENSIYLEVYDVLWQPTDNPDKYREPVVTQFMDVKQLKAVDPPKYVPPSMRKNAGDQPKPKSTVPKPPESDNDKKRKYLNKKLSDIKKLKEQKESGKILLPAQLEKIEKEREIMDEIAKLKL